MVADPGKSSPQAGSQGIHLRCGKPGLKPGLEVKGPPDRAGIVTLQQRHERFHGFQVFTLATEPEPTGSDGHVPNLFGQNDIEHVDGARVAHPIQTLYHSGRDVQAPRLQNPWHQCHPGQAAVRRLFRHLPQAVMRRKVSVVRTRFTQPALQHAEMTRFVSGHGNPVTVKRPGHVPEPVSGIQGKVDGVEFYVGDGVNQGRTALLAAKPPSRDF
jgi:hypothetical protein